MKKIKFQAYLLAQEGKLSVDKELKNFVGTKQKTEEDFLCEFAVLALGLKAKFSNQFVAASLVEQVDGIEKLLIVVDKELKPVDLKEQEANSGENS